MEFKIVIHNGMIDMVQLEQMLQSPCTLLMQRLNIMNLDRFDINSGSIDASKKSRQPKRVRES